MSRRWSTVVAASTLSLMVVVVPLSAGASPVVPPLHPRANLAPYPAYTFSSGNDRVYQRGGALPGCWRWSRRGSFVLRSTSPSCLTDELRATDRAQRAEDLSNVTLPHDYAHLTPPEQLLVLVDIDRVSRGEAPVLGLSSALNIDAQRGALDNADPVPSSTSSVTGITGAWESNYAGAINALDANYEWMYLDGWQAKHALNYDCTTPGASGCWGHRDNILANASRMPCAASCSLIMGAGFVANGAGTNYSSFSELFVQISAPAPSLSYTWSQALADGAVA